ncbi:hypothetical protein CERSUDRAFT_81022 [Gelatoporia subvermispora B]|uniref:Uncharacterized protein n=1 Tax=Ceriporiopsis subvermispora (strain B) TaxID=914234 RepID=M2PSJ7_CERS8|nr:hypothetical protein CERSUDRAFT_81022 [Gelatoporia subvermispora B]
MVLSNDLAALIGFGSEASLWGMYTVIFLVSLSVLLWRRRTRDVNWVIVSANCFLYVLATTHYAIEFNHFYTTLNAIGVVGFANETQQLVGADLLISLTDFVGDMVLIYRCYLVWGRNWYICVLPFLAALAGFACVCGVVHLVVAVAPTAPVAPAALVPLGTAGYALPLCTNVMVTSLIVGRIWWTSRGAAKNAALRSTISTTRKAMNIVVESGALYLVAQLILVVLFALGHPAQAIVAVMAVQIYGIAPTMIIIRVGLGVSSEQTTKDSGMTHISWTRPSQNRAFGQSTTVFNTVVTTVTHDEPMPNETMQMKTIDSHTDKDSISAV